MSISRCSCIIVALVVAVASASAGRSSKAGRAEQKAKESAEQIDLFTANLFHKRLSVVSSEAFVAVTYAGPLGRPRRPVGLEPAETAEYDLLWNVTEVNANGSELEAIIFQIRVSPRKEADTVAECTVNGKCFASVESGRSLRLG